MEAGNKVDRRNPLFDKVIPVRVVNGPEINSSSLQCRLLMRYHTQKGGQVDKSYRLELTSNLNHFFLYYVEISSAAYPDFQALRELNCDFSAFSVYVVKLLNDVIEAERSIDAKSLIDETDPANSGTKQQYVDLPDQLVAEFNYETRAFTFLQNSAMKVTRFLFFDLVEGDDEAIKEYLGGRLQLSLENNVEYLQRIADRESAIQQGYEERAEQQRAYAKLEEDRAAEKRQLLEEKNDLIVSYTGKLSNMQIESEKTMMQQRNAFTTEIEAMRSSNGDLDEKSAQLTSALREMDADKATLKRQFDSLTRDYEHLQQTCKEMQQAKVAVEQEYMNKDAEVTRHSFQISKLEQEVTSREQLLEATKMLQRKAEDAHAKVSEDLANARKANEQLQEFANKNNVEIKKGNDSIAQLLMSVSQLKEKINTKNSVIKTQEGVINSQKQEDQAAKEAYLKLQSEYAHAVRREDQLGEDGAAMQKKLDDAIEKIEQQDNALKYMHQTMDEQLLYGGGGGGGLGSYLPAGMGVYTGSGVMTFPEDAQTGGSSPSSVVNKDISPERARGTYAGSTMHQMSADRDNHGFKQSSATFVERYHPTNTTNSASRADFEWNESSLSSHLDLNTPSDPAVPSVTPEGASNDAPMVYTKKNIPLYKGQTSGSDTSSYGSSLNTAPSHILRSTENQILKDVGIDISEFDRGNNRSLYEDDDEEDDDIENINYYSTRAPVR